MPNIFHQSIEDILRAATPEQKILWNDIFLRYGERATASQFYYCGNITGELIATVARKLYFAYSLTIGMHNGVQLATSPLVINNDAGGQIFNLTGANAFYDGTAAANRYYSQTKELKNIVFGSISGSNLLYVKFIGYRITY